MNAVYQDFGACPCGEVACEQVGTKLNREGHLVGCNCMSHRNKRNKRKGRASEARAWKQLGGKGMTRTDDTPHAWPLAVEIENKVGNQIPAGFLNFVNSAWVEHAMFQAVKKTPVGEDSYPAIRLELTPSRAYLLVD